MGDYGVTEGGLGATKRKQPKKKKKKTKHSDQVKGGGSIAMKEMLGKVYKGKGQKLTLGQ